MRKVALLAAGAALGATLVACSSPPSNGVVESKRYEASYTYFIQTCVSYGKYGCRVYMPFPMTEPEHWQLDLYRASDKKHGWLDVPPETYQQYGVGDNFPKEGQ